MVNYLKGVYMFNLETIQKIQMRALQDPEFRKELLDQPKETLKKEYGLSPSSEIKVLENSENQLYLVIPQLTPNEMAELEKSNSGNPQLDCFNKMLVRSIKEPNFKAQLMQDPKATLEKECQIKLPKDAKTEVVQSDNKTLYLLLPSTALKNELSDEELHAIAGGVVPIVLAGVALGSLFVLGAVQLGLLIHRAVTR